MTRVGHVMILASAGSGKTYALTNRFVRLLALGAQPDRIVALTFTRKAAGEFFDEILNKLARAARDASYARQLAADIGAPALGPGEFLRMLRAVIDAMPRLRLGTLDGFFAQIARNFPLELGLAGQFEILQEYAARVERARVLRRMFERTGELDDAQREFIEAFKRATFGVEEKRLASQLDAFLDRHQEIFLSAPERDCWGEPRRIWPDGTAWLQATTEMKRAVSALRDWVGRSDLADKQRARWHDFLDACAEWAPGATPSRALAYVLEKALDAWPELEAGTAVLEFDRKKQELDASACAALAELVRGIVSGEFQRRLEMTRGIHAVLASYEAVYHDAVRRAGKLTFGDVQRLLQPGAGAPRLSVGGDVDGADERRLLIDYRLDGEIDHWLLDEFQDTSFGQWSVLENLVDEAVQDPSGVRSFFYVGDVKQAIFTWREGDPRLFREIFNRYNAIAPGTIAEEHLVKSWRSGPPVIAAVNRVFGDAAVLNELFPGEASRVWNREWRAHESARPQLGGQVALLEGEDEPARFATALAVLEEIAPLERGLSCALLVQDNATAARLADFLRREGGLPAIAESDLHVCTDNPLGSALLALMKVAAHPGDTLAWEHVQMTPLRELLEAAGCATREAVSRRILAQIHAEGFERTTVAWLRRLEPAIAADDAFTRTRARQFAAAAGLFDETGSREVAEFIQFMERHTVREAEAAEALRVMTIHKSKGLGFDIVLLPDLEGIRLDCRRDGLAVQKARDRSVEWVLDLPVRLFHARDEVLAAHVRGAEADACYENLSLLYVAMTRAKRAMYLITKPPGRSTSRNFTKLLAETLGEETQPVRIGRREFAGAYVEGDPNWVAGVVPPAPVPPRDSALPAVAVDHIARSPRLPARKPSAAGGLELSGAQLFSLAAGGAADFGTEVHRLLAEIEWTDTAAAAELRAIWPTRGVSADAAHAALESLAAPALAEVWRRRPAAEVWRERAFEVVLDGTWITGVFDRVLIERDAGGRAIRATVFDFKTDKIGAGESDLAAAAARHAPQLELYRRVVAVLAGLASDAVDCAVVFTHVRQVVPVGAAAKGSVRR